MISEEELAAIRERLSHEPGPLENHANYWASLGREVPALLAEVDRLTQVVAGCHEGADYAEGLLRRQDKTIADLGASNARLLNEVDRLRAKVAELERERPSVAHSYTRHGHGCCGQAPAERPASITSIARCGGPGLCAKCSQEAAAIHNALSTSERDGREA
jgi:hypothetical protein